MPRSPDSTTDTYLDVLRALGVSDAALHRHHDVGPGTPLRVAIDGDRGSPTADLLAALDATGRVIDLRDGIAPDDVDRLTAAFARFGVRIDCEPASDESGDVDLHVVDLVTGDADRVAMHEDAESVETALETALLEETAVELAELLDGRHLVAEPRELDALAASYGPRIQPYDDPLLVPDAAIEADGADPRADGEDLTDATEPATEETAAGESLGETVAAADAETTESIETALADSGPSTHTIEDDEALAAASSSTVGGGPRRTVSTTGIDEVFEQLESTTAETTGESAVDETDSTAPATTSTPSAMPDSTDSTTDASSEDSSEASADASASAENVHTTPNGLTGGPTRTVSSTSAADILSRATGDSDFEEIAEMEDGADPDAVLADAGDVPPALADAEASPRFETTTSESAEDDAEGPERTGDDSSDEPVAGESTTSTVTSDAAATDAPEPASAPVSEPESAAATDSADALPDPATSTPSGATRVGADGRTAIEPETADAARDSAGATDDEFDETDVNDAIEGQPSTEAYDDESDEEFDDEYDQEHTEEDDGGIGLGDDLLGEDIELRRGTETVDGPAAPEQDATDVAESASNDTAAADGPLAAAGGIDPDRSSGASNAEHDATSTKGSTDGDAVGNAETDEPDAGTEADAGPGIVRRITSTLFGR